MDEDEEQTHITIPSSSSFFSICSLIPSFSIFFFLSSSHISFSIFFLSLRWRRKREREIKMCVASVTEFVNVHYSIRLFPRVNTFVWCPLTLFLNFLFSFSDVNSNLCANYNKYTHKNNPSPWFNFHSHKVHSSRKKRSSNPKNICKLMFIQKQKMDLICTIKRWWKCVHVQWTELKINTIVTILIANGCCSPNNNRGHDFLFVDTI